ncbi:DUF3726 domain-containing protein [Pelagibacterales bacterium SAG-MED01]|nr:DUF3726 domain-containing protein [Pelagibacterales bacterium SAG-MED01]
MKSLSEIETTSKRASRAVGFSWGVAEEIAKGVRQLELFGFPGIKNLSQYYKLINKKKFEKLTIIKKNNKSNKSSLCPVDLGVRFLDQIKTLESLKKITFYKIAHPILFLPFLSRSSEIVGKRILLKFEKNTLLLNFNVNILSKFIKNEFPSIAKKVEVIFLENKDFFSEKEWKNLYKLSENTFVEETDSLKQGAAGAGLTDND